MNDSTYEFAHKITTINQHKLVNIIPKKIIRKEEKILQKFTETKATYDLILRESTLTRSPNPQLDPQSS